MDEREYLAERFQEHRSQPVRSGVASEGGWPLYLRRYAALFNNA